MFNTELLSWQNFVFVGIVALVWLVIIGKFQRNHLEENQGE